MNETIAEYLAKIGAVGGKSGTGKKKARTTAQAKRAARARWKKYSGSIQKGNNASDD